MQIERELMRGAAPLAVLQLLSQRELYGYQLVETLSRDSGALLSMGQSTLYPLLYNLEAKGLVSSREAKADNGRYRKYYSITEAGRKRLASDTLQWLNLEKALSLLGVGQSPSAARA